MLKRAGRYLGLDIALKEVEASTKYEVSLCHTSSLHVLLPPSTRISADQSVICHGSSLSDKSEWKALTTE